MRTSARRGSAILPFVALAVAAILTGAAIVIFVGGPSHARRVVTVIRPGTSTAATSAAAPSTSDAPPSTTQLTSTVTTTSQAPQALPAAGQYLVDLGGTVGSLAFNKATESDVVDAWGQPQFQGQTTPPVSGYDLGTILAYGCGSENRSDNAPGLIDVGPTTHGRVGCGDLFYMNSVTARLVGFESADPRVHTIHGTYPGTPQGEANRREGVIATVGCIGGIFEKSDAATLELENRGGEPVTGSANLTTGVVSVVSLEATRNAVGIQFC